MADLNKLRQVNPHWEPSFNLKKGYGDPVKEIMSQQIDEELEKDELEVAKNLIVDKITKHFHDVMFEMVNEEMMEHKVFQSQNYFTDAGYEMFEDEYFEFYHEHHGDILYEVMQNITH